MHWKTLGESFQSQREGCLPFKETWVSLISVSRTVTILSLLAAAEPSPSQAQKQKCDASPCTDDYCSPSCPGSNDNWSSFPASCSVRAATCLPSSSAATWQHRYASESALKKTNIELKTLHTGVESNSATHRRDSERILDAFHSTNTGRRASSKAIWGHERDPRSVPTCCCGRRLAVTPRLTCCSWAVPHALPVGRPLRSIVAQGALQHLKTAEEERGSLRHWGESGVVGRIWAHVIGADSVWSLPAANHGTRGWGKGWRTGAFWETPRGALWRHFLWGSCHAPPPRGHVAWMLWSRRWRWRSCPSPLAHCLRQRNLPKHDSSASEAKERGKNHISSLSGQQIGWLTWTLEVMESVRAVCKMTTGSRGMLWCVKTKQRLYGPTRLFMSCQLRMGCTGS